MATTNVDDASRVLVSSTRQLLLPANPSYLDEFDLQVERCSITCASGDHEEGRWRGVPVEALLHRVDADERSTHLLVAGEDGYRSCVPIADAIGALLAVAREDVQQDGTLPRIVGDELDGAEMVASVERIETIRLDPDEDASEYTRSPTIGP